MWFDHIKGGRRGKRWEDMVVKKEQDYSPLDPEPLGPEQKLALTEKMGKETESAGGPPGSLRRRRGRKRPESGSRSQRSLLILGHESHAEPTRKEIMRCQVLSVIMTLCNPVDCSPPGSSVCGILPARTLQWVPRPPPGDLPDPGTESPSLMSPALAGGFFTTCTTWEAKWIMRLTDLPIFIEF